MTVADPLRARLSKLNRGTQGKSSLSIPGSSHAKAVSTAPDKPSAGALQIRLGLRRKGGRFCHLIDRPSHARGFPGGQRRKRFWCSKNRGLRKTGNVKK